MYSYSWRKLAEHFSEFPPTEYDEDDISPVKPDSATYIVSCIARSAVFNEYPVGNIGVWAYWWEAEEHAERWASDAIENLQGDLKSLDQWRRSDKKEGRMNTTFKWVNGEEELVLRVEQLYVRKSVQEEDFERIKEEILEELPEDELEDYRRNWEGRGVADYSIENGWWINKFKQLDKEEREEKKREEELREEEKEWVKALREIDRVKAGGAHKASWE